MKKKADVVRGWLRKAASDVVILDETFWPTVDTAKRAHASALAIRDFIFLRLPEDILGAGK